MPNPLCQASSICGLPVQGSCARLSREPHPHCQLLAASSRQAAIPQAPAASLQRQITHILLAPCCQLHPAPFTCLQIMHHISDQQTMTTGLNSTCLRTAASWMWLQSRPCQTCSTRPSGRCSLSTGTRPWTLPSMGQYTRPACWGCVLRFVRAANRLMVVVRDKSLWPVVPTLQIAAHGFSLHGDLNMGSSSSHLLQSSQSRSQQLVALAAESRAARQRC